MFSFTFLLLAAAAALSPFFAPVDYHRTKTAGKLAQIPLLFVFALVPRNSLWSFFMGISFEHALHFHKLLAYITVFLGLVHGYWAGFACYPYSHLHQRASDTLPASEWPWPWPEHGFGTALPDQAVPDPVPPNWTEEQ